MLYITTRDKHNAYTVSRAIHEDRGPDGGFYLPFRMPRFEQEALATLQEKSFAQSVAEILNLFFSCGLTPWDVEFAVGRHPVKLSFLQQRISVAELWHNQKMDYSGLVQALTQKICGKPGIQTPSSWVKIAIRIGVLFGIYGQMHHSGVMDIGSLFDVALPTGDFSGAMACWYARQMGLPVGNIICSCNENSGVWDLLHLGEVRTDVSAVNTCIPESDIPLPEEVERLICAALGVDETAEYCAIRNRGGIYRLLPVTLDMLRKGMFAAVVSQSRLEAVIPSVYRTAEYIMNPYTALAYSGLADYRAKTGESRTALLLADKNPLSDAQVVTSAMNMSLQEVKEILGII